MSVRSALACASSVIIMRSVASSPEVVVPSRWSRWTGLVRQIALMTKMNETPNVPTHPTRDRRSAPTKTLLGAVVLGLLVGTATACGPTGSATSTATPTDRANSVRTHSNSPDPGAPVDTDTPATDSAEPDSGSVTPAASSPNGRSSGAVDQTGGSSSIVPRTQPSTSTPTPAPAPAPTAPPVPVSNPPAPAPTPTPAPPVVRLIGTSSSSTADYLGGGGYLITTRFVLTFSDGRTETITKQVDTTRYSREVMNRPTWDHVSTIAPTVRVQLWLEVTFSTLPSPGPGFGPIHRISYCSGISGL